MGARNKDCRHAVRYAAAGMTGFGAAVMASALLLGGAVAEPIQQPLYAGTCALAVGSIWCIDKTVQLVEALLRGGGSRDDSDGRDA